MGGGVGVRKSTLFITIRGQKKDIGTVTGRTAISENEESD
jgi:hypothetical protein